MAYSISATTKGGRNGRAILDNGGLALAMGLQKEFGGNGEGHNPEQLFAMGYAACFGGAVGFVARQQKITPTQITVTADVHIGKQGEGLGLGVALTIKVDGVDRATAEKLVQAAHQVCPYSKATRNNIEVELNVA